MKSKPLLCLALVLSGGLLGCSTTNQQRKWPVFYDCEKGPDRLSISRASQSMDFYTNGIPDWNYDLRVPPAKINSAELNELGERGGLRILEVRLALKDMYYTDELMILQEVEAGRFLPVYVQDYNRDVRWPTVSSIIKAKKTFVVKTGMDYAGTGHFHFQCKITVSPNHDPVVAGSFH